MDNFNWNHQQPTKSGRYITSIGMKWRGEGRAFIYVAYFDIESKEWYRDSPWEDVNPQNRILIPDKILGWCEATPYLGLQGRAGRNII